VGVVSGEAISAPNNTPPPSDAGGTGEPTSDPYNFVDRKEIHRVYVENAASKGTGMPTSAPYKVYTYGRMVVPRGVGVLMGEVPL